MKQVLKWVRRLTIALVVLILMLLAAPYLIPVPGYAGVPDTLPFPNSMFIEVDGASIHYRYFGPDTEEPRANVALIHGFCGSTFSWRKQIDALTGLGYRVCAVDLPSFGYSDRSPDVDHSATARANYVWGALSHAAEAKSIAPEEPWVVVGHSMGGGVITAMANVAPERTAGVVYVDGGGWRPPRTSAPAPSISARVRTAAMGFGPLRRWVEVYAQYAAFTEDNIRTLLTSAFGETPDDEAVKGYLDALKVPRTASSILDQWRNRGDGTSYDASKIEAPVLIIWGSEDTWVSIENGERLHKAIEGSEMHVIDGAGHNVMETHELRFNTTLLAFLNLRIVQPRDSEPQAVSEIDSRVRRLLEMYDRL